MGTYTTNKTMYKPAYKEVQYHTLVNANFDIIDANAFWLEFANANTCSVAAGTSFIRLSGLQVDGVAMTGTLHGAYIDVSNGSTAATGTIRAMELKARTEAPGDTGNDVAVLEGLSISADSKGHSVTTVMRAAEFICDGSAGGTIAEMVGLRLANNLQANKATKSFGLEIYKDSFQNTADIRIFEVGGGGNYIGFLGPSSIAADVVWTLPSTDGSANQVIKTNGSGALSWVSALFTGDVGIADNNILAVDQAAGGGPADDDYAKFTASGIEGRSYSEVLSDLSLDANLKDLTAGEIGQLENIGITTISSAQWGYLGACGTGGGQLLAALTTGESTQLEAIGVTTISAAQWGYVGALTSEPIEGDGTAGRILRQVDVAIQNGTDDFTLKCKIDSLWNGDTIGNTDNIGKGATVGDFSLSANGETLTIEASGLTGNCVMAFGIIATNASGTGLTPVVYSSGNDIVIWLRHSTTGANQDITNLADTGDINISALYLTSA